MDDWEDKKRSYSDSPPETIEVLGVCAVCVTGVSIVAARWNGGHLVKCLSCGATWTVGDTESGISDEVVSSSVPGGGGQTSGLPGGPEITQPPVPA